MLGKRIAEVRRAQGRSQPYVAERIGWDQAVVSRIENGHRDVKVVELVKIAGALDVPVSDLLPKEYNEREWEARRVLEAYYSFSDDMRPAILNMLEAGARKIEPELPRASG